MALISTSCKNLLQLTPILRRSISVLFIFWSQFSFPHFRSSAAISNTFVNYAFKDAKSIKKELALLMPEELEQRKKLEGYITVDEKV